MGINYNAEKGTFEFDFEHDGREDIISLTGSGYQVEAFGKCFYYGYEFADSVESQVRAAFIQYVKFTEDIASNPELSRFVQRAVDHLNRQIDLYDYDLVVMPQSSSRLNQYMLRYIYRFAQPMLRAMDALQNFLRFQNEDDKALCNAIRHQNILIVDDVTTSGSTLNEILRALRVLNEDNKISIFSLLGRKDLIVEK